MGGWYIVIKTIKGRRYRYRQRTWREGGEVRTESHSLGPAAASETPAKAVKPSNEWATAAARAHLGPVFADLTDAQHVKQQWFLPWDVPGAPKGKFRKHPALDALVSATGVQIGRADDKAFYSPGSDRICMPPKANFGERPGYSASESYYHTLLHELAHWTGHRSRLDRFPRMSPQDPRYKQYYAREELIAEATAVIVMRAMGLERNDLSISRAYFRVWLDRTDNQEAALSSLYPMKCCTLAT